MSKGSRATAVAVVLAIVSVVLVLTPVNLAEWRTRGIVLVMATPVRHSNSTAALILAIGGILELLAWAFGLANH